MIKSPNSYWTELFLSWLKKNLFTYYVCGSFVYMYVLTLKDDMGSHGLQFKLSWELIHSLLQFRLTLTPTKTFLSKVLLWSQASEFPCRANSVLGGRGVGRMMQKSHSCHGLKPLTSCLKSVCNSFLSWEFLVFFPFGSLGRFSNPAATQEILTDKQMRHGFMQQGLWVVAIALLSLTASFHSYKKWVSSLQRAFLLWFPMPGLFMCLLTLVSCSIAIFQI